MADAPDNSYQPENIHDWRQWLAENHTRKEGIWLIRYKQTSGKCRFEFDEAVDEAICFGWIDSKVNKLDEDRSMLWFAPRKPKTGWSKVNKDKVERLMKAGRLQQAGLEKIQKAKQDGSWDKLNDIDSLIVPDDLLAMFVRFPGSQSHFEAFPRSVKRGILEWISTAKKLETRAKRLEETARLAAENIRANQWKEKK